MRCPYRKIYTKDALDFGKSVAQDLEEFPECHGESCPLYNDKLTVPCSRATKERNEAFMMIKVTPKEKLRWLENMHYFGFREEDR